MRFKKNLSPLIGLFLMAESQTAISEISNNDISNQEIINSDCKYQEIEQPEYILSGMAKKHVTNSIRSAPAENFDSQRRNKKYFDPVVLNTFKFSLEIKNKKYHEQYQKQYQKGYIFDLNGISYVYRGHEFVKIVTSTCHTFWFDRVSHADYILRNVQRADGEELKFSDYQFILGGKNIQEYNIPKAEVIIDPQKASIKIIGLYDKHMMFKGFGSTKTGKLNNDYVQLYSEIIFFKNWADLDSAYDENSTSRKLVRLDKSIDCSNEHLGCKYTEIVGIELPISYLEMKTNGFNMKVSGKQVRTLKVNGYQVRQILEAIKDFR